VAGDDQLVGELPRDAGGPFTGATARQGNLVVKAGQTPPSVRAPWCFWIWRCWIWHAASRRGEFECYKSDIAL